MKKLFFILLFIIFVPALGAESTPVRDVISCQLSGSTRVTPKASTHGLDGDELLTEIDGKTERAFLDMPDTDFIGNVVLATHINRTLISVIDYGPPYRKGLAIRENPKTHNRVNNI